MKIIMDQEYQKAVSVFQVVVRLENNFREFQLDEFKTGRPAQGLKEIPCLDSKKAVMDCYKANADCPMNCAKIVQAFQECVDYKRTCLLASRVATSKG